MRRPFQKIVVFLALFLSVPLFAFAAGPVDLTILHVNDLHGRLLPYQVKTVDEKTPVSGAAYLAWMIGEERTRDPEGTLLLSAGDMFQGTPASNLFRGKPVIEVMNLLGFDAMTIGNHEFDWGLEVLGGLRESARFPFLSANIFGADGTYLAGVRPWIIVERKGVKIAVIGISTPETAFTTKPDIVKGLTFGEPGRLLPGLIRETREKGAKVVVVLSHLGFDVDKALAAEMEGIDVIVGGHSHTAVKDPARVGRTIIVQAGYNGIYLGVLRLKVDSEAGSLLDYTKENELRVVAAGPENRRDEKAEKIVNAYNDQLRESFEKVIGETPIDLTRDYNAESALGDLITDALRGASGADIAFESSGSIRADIPKGAITMEQVFTVLPFDDVVITMDLTGRQILKVLEQASTLEMGMLQVSGLMFAYDPAKPAGARVVRVLVGDKPLEDGKSYRVAVDDFLAAGGDRYVTFKEGRNLRYGDPLRDIFVAFLRDHSPVSPKTEGRIVKVK
jgi:2',3'-cyclic-nucleotide 2'-phosphodiesterase (5'-nucleotidase family)